jgi:hypothetical protein
MKFKNQEEGTMIRCHFSGAVRTAAMFLLAAASLAEVRADSGSIAAPGTVLAGYVATASLNIQVIAPSDTPVSRLTLRLNGDDVTRSLSLGFFDALRGYTSEMVTDAEVSCSRCNGSGRVQSRHRRSCPDCAGYYRTFWRSLFPKP